MSNPRKPRIAVATALTASLVAAFAAMGGVGVAQSAISAVQYQYGPKVTICHKGKTITVAKPAVPAHLRHGDTVGSCTGAAAPAKTEEAKAEKVKKTEKPGNGKGRGRGK